MGLAQCWQCRLFLSHLFSCSSYRIFVSTLKTAAKDNINKGRQVELDIAKAISIVFMILTHVEIIAVLFSNTISYDYHYIVTLVSGGVFSAPVFMFCMGVGLVYSRNTQWNFLIKRGFNLFIMAIFVNVCEFIIPHFLSEILLGNSQKFPIFGGLILFYCDILFFASLSFILIGILKKLNISIKMMFVFGLVLHPVLGLISIFIGSLLALPISLLMLWRKNEKMVPFGPFLLISFTFIYFTKIDFNMILDFLRLI